MEELMNYVHQHGLFEGDYGIHFTTDEVFPLREDLLEWVRRVGYGLGFVIVIIRSDIANGKQGRKTYVLLRGGSYRKYKDGLEVSVIGRLKTNEHSMLVDMTKSMVKPDSDNYLHWSTCHESSNIVSDIFWTHPDVVKLLNAFNIVFLMDTTYKINKYRLPLLEIVGVTCTSLSFSTGFAFLSSEKEKNFMGPEVIVCDRDLSLMNAINIVFPKTRNLLCRFNINKNAKAKCKMLVDSTEAWEVEMDSWKTIIDCTKIVKFVEFEKIFETICSPWPLLFEYVKNTWIISHKEKFVKCWTNLLMHLGNTTSNSMGNLCSCLDAIKHVIILQHNEIKASFQMSLHVIGHTFNVQLYKMLVDSISKHALILIAEEFDRVNDVGFGSERCGCVLRQTHGLPCVCQLARYVMGVIHLNEVRVMWTRLSFSGLSECDSSYRLSIQQE
ncbi:uncharacterized protein [Phaseolus vulgaris]|uniref:uncharacterized protein n=1 Tax=Phaseolus vulgaris TaxID=3885 RepID=UPI0035CA7BB9